MNLKLMLAYAIGILSAIFVVQNLETVQVNFLLWTMQMPRALMLLIVFVAGAVSAWLVATLKRHDRPPHE
ncbi:MAG: LapA family protein [Gammaproteobacteria bacterium]|nr:LapA family protein [Gammaproteobacteria bacterium]MDH3412969.1 LapA family protein [Gammaproteobacteria bacterium]